MSYLIKSSPIAVPNRKVVGDSFIKIRRSIAKFMKSHYSASVPYINKSRMKNAHNRANSEHRNTNDIAQEALSKSRQTRLLL